MTDYLTEIRSRVRTVDERSEFMAQLDVLKKGLYLTGNKALEYRASLSPWMSKLIVQKEDLRRMEEVMKWPVVILLVPQSVSEQGVQMISGWLRKNVDSNILLEVRLDKTLGMGPVLEYQGRVRDYSVKNRLDQYGI